MEIEVPVNTSSYVESLKVCSKEQGERRESGREHGIRDAGERKGKVKNA